MKFVFNDGGRAAAGYRGNAGDCVTRAIAIASGRPYQEVYDYLAKMNQAQRRSKNSVKYKSSHGKKTAAKGIFVQRKWFKDYMKQLGFKWVATMGIGTGCTVHLRETELPTGRLVVHVSRHSTAVIDHEIHDTYNPDRDGMRCVYGYYIMEK